MQLFGGYHFASSHATPQTVELPLTKQKLNLTGSEDFVPKQISQTAVGDLFDFKCDYLNQNVKKFEMNSKLGLIRLTIKGTAKLATGRQFH